MKGHEIPMRDVVGRDIPELRCWLCALIPPDQEVTMDYCDRCQERAELYHNDRFGGSLCEACDREVNAMREDAFLARELLDIDTDLFSALREVEQYGPDDRVSYAARDLVEYHAKLGALLAAMGVER